MLKDENDDGIFEPGEHIIARNITVRNHGTFSPLLCNSIAEHKQEKCLLPVSLESESRSRQANGWIRPPSMKSSNRPYQFPAAPMS